MLLYENGVEISIVISIQYPVHAHVIMRFYVFSKMVENTYHSVLASFFAPEMDTSTGDCFSQKMHILTLKKWPFWYEIAITLLHFPLFFFAFFFVIKVEKSKIRWAAQKSCLFWQFLIVKWRKKWRKIGPNNLCRLSLDPLRTTPFPILRVPNLYYI